jgi:hypothetical protein
VPTPLGSYNPDWAVLVEQGRHERLYFVVETKSSLFTDDLRPALVDDLGNVGVLGPYEVLQQLGRLHGQGGGKASRVVELLPVTLGTEGQQALGEFFGQMRHA